MSRYIIPWRMCLILFFKGITIKNLELSNQPVEDLIGFPIIKGKDNG